MPCTVFSKALSGIGIASPCRCPPCPHPAQMPSKPSNITVRNNLFFIVSPNFGNGSSGLSAFRRTKTAPICKNKKLLRKTTDRTGESLRVAGKSVANAPRPARSATPLGTESSQPPERSGKRPAGKPSESLCFAYTIACPRFHKTPYDGGKPSRPPARKPSKAFAYAK